MKTTLLYITTLAILASAALTSCDKNVHYNLDSKMLDFHFALRCSREMMEVADIEVTYADSVGKIITDTITIDKMDVLNEHHEYVDGTKYDDTTSMVIWTYILRIDSIPTRLYITPRFLPKPISEENKDRMYSLQCEVNFQCMSGAFYSYRKADFPLERVRGSKIKPLFDIVNEEPMTLDYTLQPKRTEPGNYELVENK